MKRLQILMIFASFFVLLGILRAEESARIWQTKTGEKLDAVWDIEADDAGESIILVNKGKKIRILLENLSDEDVQYVQEHRKGNTDEIPPGEKMTLTVNGVDYTFCWCPAGCFLMGSPETEENHQVGEKQQEVTLSHGFWMLETEVTQEMWKSLMAKNPSFYKGDNLPVEKVSWNDCQEFVEKLNQETGIPAGFKVSLPTEAQWEYACRAGTETPFSFGSQLNGDKANCDGRYPYGTETSGPCLARTAVVKSYDPNEWGLYDMYGNVREWCSGWYGEYQNDKVTDPAGPENGTFRVERGGGWFDTPSYCRSASRIKHNPAIRNDFLGFRLALVPNK